MRIFRFSGADEVKQLMRQIGVDPYGAKIMLPKAGSLLVRLGPLSNIAANVLKQEMLSLGADAAITRGSLTGQAKKTEVLLFGRLDQLTALTRKLKFQPFGLRQLGSELARGIDNYAKNNFTLSLRKGSLNLNKARIMGIINLTPDSFSGDGLYRYACDDHPQLALDKAGKMARDGADIIDLGGQSSRPGSKKISLKDELARTVPVVRLLAKKIDKPLSIDTDKPEVARAALDAGAQIINDISGLKDPAMIKIAARYKAAVVIMHMRGEPVSMQKNIAYDSLIGDITDYLSRAIQAAENGGISPDKIIIDPGIGFGKTPAHNLRIIKQLEDFKLLGKPVLLGPSRKSFLGAVIKAGEQDRLNATLAACVLAAVNGARILRVHDVKAVAQAIKITEAVKNAGE